MPTVHWTFRRPAVKRRHSDVVDLISFERFPGVSHYCSKFRCRSSYSETRQPCCTWRAAPTQTWRRRSTSSRRYSGRISRNSVAHSTLRWKNAGNSRNAHFPAHNGRFGWNHRTEMTICRYYPKGGGYCIMNVRPIKTLSAIEHIDFGQVNEIFGWSFVAGSMPLCVFRSFLPSTCCLTMQAAEMEISFQNYCFSGGRWDDEWRQSGIETSLP